MPELTGHAHVDAPPERVFDVVDDWHNTTRYLRGLVRWEPVDPEKVQGLGTRFAAAIKGGPMTLDGVMEVTEHVRPERIAFRSIEGPKLNGLWAFESEDGGTRVTLTNTFELRRSRRVAAPFPLAGRLTDEGE